MNYVTIILIAICDACSKAVNSFILCRNKQALTKEKASLATSLHLELANAKYVAVMYSFGFCLCKVYTSRKSSKNG